MVRNLTARKILRVVIPLAFWLGVWQLAAVWVDTVYQPGRGYLLLPAPTLVAGRLAALMGEPAFWQAAAVSLGRIFGGFALGPLPGRQSRCSPPPSPGRTGCWARR